MVDDNENNYALKGCQNNAIEEPKTKKKVTML